MDSLGIKGAIMSQAVLFELNSTEVMYKTDGLEFSIIRDPNNKIFFLAKNGSSVHSKEFVKRPYSVEELMDEFVAFIHNILIDEFKDIPPA